MWVTDTGSGEGQVNQQAVRDFVLPADTCATTTATYIMKRQKNLVQSKRVQKTPERGLGEIDLTNLPEKKFKIKVITMRMDLQRNVQELKEQVQRENTEIKQSLEGLKSTLDEVQEAINGNQRTGIQRS